MTPVVFLRWAILAIVVSRLGLVFVTPAADQNIDLSIYREVGELVVNGVDPYDFSSQLSLREKLRLNEKGAVPYVKETAAGCAVLGRSATILSSAKLMVAAAYSTNFAEREAIISSPSARARPARSL
jgi:hypothetical protein